MEFIAQIAGNFAITIINNPVAYIKMLTTQEIDIIRYKQ